MNTFNRQLHRLFVLVSCLLAFSAPAITWASNLMLESAEFGHHATAFSVESGASLSTGYTFVVSSDTDISRFGSDADFETESPASRVLAWHDAQTLSICQAMYFAPHSLRLAFASNVNAPIDEHNNRLLHLASRSGNLAALWHLLELGADTNVRNKFSRTPRDVAYQGNRLANECIHAALSKPDHSFSEIFYKRPDAATKTM